MKMGGLSDPMGDTSCEGDVSRDDVLDVGDTSGCDTVASSATVRVDVWKQNMREVILHQICSLFQSAASGNIQGKK